jgi:hypothetical protein
VARRGAQKQIDRAHGSSARNGVFLVLKGSPTADGGRDRREAANVEGLQNERAGAVKRGGVPGRSHRRIRDHHWRSAARSPFSNRIAGSGGETNPGRGIADGSGPGLQAVGGGRGQVARADRCDKCREGGSAGARQPCRGQGTTPRARGCRGAGRCGPTTFSSSPVWNCARPRGRIRSGLGRGLAGMSPGRRMRRKDHRERGDREVSMMRRSPAISSQAKNLKFWWPSRRRPSWATRRP